MIAGLNSNFYMKHIQSICTSISEVIRVFIIRFCNKSTVLKSVASCLLSKNQCGSRGGRKNAYCCIHIFFLSASLDIIQHYNIRCTERWRRKYLRGAELLAMEMWDASLPGKMAVTKMSLLDSDRYSKNCKQPWVTATFLLGFKIWVMLFGYAVFGLTEELQFTYSNLKPTFLFTWTKSQWDLPMQGSLQSTEKHNEGTVWHSSPLVRKPR